MTESMVEAPAVSGPLVEAQSLVTQLQSQAGNLDPATMQDELAKLQALISAAVENGAGADAEQMRAELNRVIAETASFTSVMVHEVRKPMTSIRGYADMLAKPDLIGPLNDMQKQFMDIIRNNVMSMEALVTDISDFNKINSGRMKLDSKMTTFGQVIMDAQKQTEPLIAKYGHQVSWDVPQGLPILVTDAKQLAKVIVKFAQNGLQYTPPGEGQLTISAAKLEGNLIQVTVTDNGIGMKPEEVARLGEPFYRADHELVTSQKGYGLGIPVAFGLLKMMNSPVEVNSTLGTGTSISFQISGMG